MSYVLIKYILKKWTKLVFFFFFFGQFLKGILNEYKEFIFILI